MQVRLTTSGGETLHGVGFSLRAPQGWQVKPVGPTVFGTVAPAQAPVVKFIVTPPAGPGDRLGALRHVGLGGKAQRQSGATVRVTG